jgi:hypothetical protein
MKLRVTLTSVVVGAYLLGLGMLAGLVVDHMLFDRQRAMVLGRYEEALRQWHAYQIRIEKASMEP